MSRMISWQDRIYYDVGLDAQVARISGFDENHQEHWMIVDVGKGYADRRLQAVCTIRDSIEAGDPAGQVVEVSCS